MSITKLVEADGLDPKYRPVVSELVWQLRGHAAHNQLVQSYYDQDFSVHDPIFEAQIASTQFSNLWTCGWGTKAVDALAERISFGGFVSSDGSENEALDFVVANNNLLDAYTEAMPSKLTHGCMFATVNQGVDGHAHIRFHDARSAAALEPEDYQAGSVSAGICIARARRTELSPHTAVPVQVNVHLPGEVIVFTSPDGTNWSAEVRDTGEREPMMVAFTHLGTANQPFGRTRITRYVRNLTDEASRTLFHLQVLGAFHMMPRLAIMGLTDAQFDAMQSSKFKHYIDGFSLYTRDNEGNVPSIQQITPTSPQPLLETIYMLAKQLSGETGVPLNSLGITTDNPSSADAINAAREDICNVAQRDIEKDKLCLRRVARLALAVERDTTVDSLPLLDSLIVARFASPNVASLAATTDAAVKYASIRSGFGETDVCAEMLGFDATTVDRISAETQRAAGLDLMSDMLNS